MTASEHKLPRTRNATLEMLSATFPVFRDCLPLAVGIHKVIKEKLPDIDAGQLRAAMKIHTASTKYLKVLSQGTSRFDLDGNVAGEVTPEQRKQATDGLRERFRKGAERKKAEQQEKERQDKLLQLAAKFSKQ
jgi:ProP effector